MAHTNLVNSAQGKQQAKAQEGVNKGASTSNPQVGKKVNFKNPKKFNAGKPNQQPFAPAASTSGGKPKNSVNFQKR